MQVSEIHSLMRNPATRTLAMQIIREGALISIALVILGVGTSRKGLEIARLAARKKTHDKLRRKFVPAMGELAEKVEREAADSTVVPRKIIWTLWLQGEDEAPELSRKCFASVRRHMPDYELVVLSEATIADYIELPAYILEKYRAGTITPTHFSDVVRVELLTRYGGIWMDATVLLTGALPCSITDSELFMYQALKPGLNGEILAVSSWFIVSQGPSRILLMTRDLLREYWASYDHMVDYFLLHHFIQMAIEAYPDEWARVVPRSNSTPHILLLRLFEKRDEKVLADVLAQTSVHKLSNKLDLEGKDLVGTYYEALLSSESAAMA